ncbi:unnamed protein product [Auanema sp. JU1783]|nr:unnamed protein product [Auanema sp. JU1783]
MHRSIGNRLGNLREIVFLEKMIWNENDEINRRKNTNDSHAETHAAILWSVATCATLVNSTEIYENVELEEGAFLAFSQQGELRQFFFGKIADEMKNKL